MNLEEIQKFLDDNNITFEEYMRQNMVSEEDKKYVDKVWIEALYRNFGNDT